MKLDVRSAGALVAVGGALFVLLSFGVPRFSNLIEHVADIDLPYTLVNCCGCTGIGLLAAPLILLAVVLFRSPKDAPPE